SRTRNSAEFSLPARPTRITVAKLSSRSPIMRTLLAFALLLVPALSHAQEAKKKPNIVLIFCDDLGYGDPSCFGNKKTQTPNIDRIAKGGMRFTSFYVPQAVCSASRAALLTGRYPNRVGILGALGPNAKNGITANERTLAAIL